MGFIVFLLIFPHLVPLPFYSYADVCFVAIYLMLRWDGRSFSDIDLKKEKITFRAILLGFITAVAWVAFMQLFYIPGIKFIFQVPDYSEYNFIRSSLTRLLMTLVAAVLIGGFYEEVAIRGYIQNVLEQKILKKYSPLISMFTTSLLFGLYHIQQDVFAIFSAFLGGLYWAILCRKFHNLWIPIFSHALFDSITLILIYKGVFGLFNY
ncbi:hypothetical protein DBR39_04085 [Chryseobacterium sp. KBW03]|uniref:CPBP family intramembrane glutamic endopeptidase n=1 Tax=Chryseobacterium TaxID=59732 RepID=UPI000F50B401|nr:MULTISPECIES: type II CAAX endopeptidase family protein [Chryseobacterium]MEB4760766.1 type II CAAX endopeptidase family protein [Chryseobacterium indologenes]RQO40137.1 hypothetical protein DBR39_04085 [Chryseobacterium sp. KBW03]